jgi:hypothetical protein
VSLAHLVLLKSSEVDSPGTAENHASKRTFFSTLSGTC